MRFLEIDHDKAFDKQRQNKAAQEAQRKQGQKTKGKPKKVVSLSKALQKAQLVAMHKVSALVANGQREREHK